MTWPKMFLNERDVENTSLLNFVKNHSDIQTVLDVGITYSAYVKELKENIDYVYGVDPNPIDEANKNLVSGFYNTDVCDMDGRKKFDLVCSISSIEHYGVNNHKNLVFSEKDFYHQVRDLQVKVLTKIEQLSKRYIFVTFPFGQQSFEENNYCNLTPEVLGRFNKMTKLSSLKVNYYFNEHAQLGFDWKSISEERAKSVEYRQDRGVRCVAILEGTK